MAAHTKATNKWMKEKTAEFQRAGQGGTREKAESIPFRTEWMFNPISIEISFDLYMFNTLKQSVSTMPSALIWYGCAFPLQYTQQAQSVYLVCQPVTINQNVIRCDLHDSIDISLSRIIIT